MFRIPVTLAFILFILTSCSDKKQVESITGDNSLIAGKWDASLLFKDKNGIDRSIDFILWVDTVKIAGDTHYYSPEVNIMNGNHEEFIPQDIEWLSEDSVRIKSRFFDSWLDVAIHGDTLSGEWTNAYRSEDYKMPFLAVRNKPYDKLVMDPEHPINGRWSVVFSPNEEHPDTAVGVFLSTKDLELFGTFLTETGDYRFLQGKYENGEYRLSTFDGSHAYLFTAKFRNSNSDTLDGVYYSGNHYQNPWIAWRNDSAELRDPYSLTTIEDPDSALHFSFTDLNGKRVSLDDSTFAGKPVVIQIMGSWCPNCMDETAFFRSIYPAMKSRHVEMVSLAFEAADSSKAIGLLERYKKNMDVPWDILYAGPSNKSKAAERLPRLEHIMSFPTTIYLRPDHTVYRIHTGFSGPATGEVYHLQGRKVGGIIKDLYAMYKESVN